MGQQANRSNQEWDVLDTVITNALIVDAVTGIIKADIGIKVNFKFYAYALKELINLYPDIICYTKIVTKCLVTRVDTACATKPITAFSHEPISALM